MDYRLAIEGAPETVPSGTAILLLHPSTAATDRIDTDFLRVDTDRFLVVSTRTTAREVQQKLDYYDVDAGRAEILDTLSVERGIGRRNADHIHYVASPDDVDAVLDRAKVFLHDNEGKRRVSFDSVTELAYYADEERAEDALARFVALLKKYDAVGLFHVDVEVHDATTVERFRELCDGAIRIGEDSEVTAEF